MAFSACCNFKIFRLIYTRFFGFDNFNAPFDEPNTFFKPFTQVSIFSVLFTSIPVMVGCIVGLVYIDWGYQL